MKTIWKISIIFTIFLILLIVGGFIVWWVIWGNPIPNVDTAVDSCSTS